MTQAPAPWTPQSHHITQLEDWGDGTGLNGHDNCGPASLVRYLRECRHPDLASMTDHDAINWARTRLTGVPNGPTNGPTFTWQFTTLLDSLGFDGSWTTDLNHFDDAGCAEILLLDGTRLAPAQYPPSWFNDPGQINHIIVRLPNGVYNDPLAYWNNQQDCSYDDAAVIAALRAEPQGYVNVLPDPHTVSWLNGKAVIGVVVPPPAPAPVPKPPVGAPPPPGTHQGPRYKVLVQMLARKQPNESQDPSNIFFLPDGQPQQVYPGAVLNGTGQSTGHWRQVTAGGNACWLAVKNLQAV